MIRLQDFGFRPDGHLKYWIVSRLNFVRGSTTFLLRFPKKLHGYRGREVNMGCCGDQLRYQIFLCLSTIDDMATLMSNPVHVICTCASFGCAEQSVITESGILQLSDVWAQFGLKAPSPSYVWNSESLEQLKALCDRRTFCLAYKLLHKDTGSNVCYPVLVVNLSFEQEYLFNETGDLLCNSSISVH